MSVILAQKRQRWITGANPKAALIERFVNQMMQNGKKILAYRIFLKSIAYISEKFIAELDKQSESTVKNLCFELISKIYQVNNTNSTTNIKNETKKSIFNELLSYLCIRTNYKVNDQSMIASNSIMKKDNDLYWQVLSIILRDVIESVRPLLEVRSKRVGGANYQVPEAVNENRGTTLAIRWILNSAKKKVGLPMYKSLGEEMYDALQNKGMAVKKRDESIRMAQSNRAFAHLSRLGRR